MSIFILIVGLLFIPYVVKNDNIDGSVKTGCLIATGVISGFAMFL